MPVETHTIPTTEDHTIAATLFRPDEANEKLVVINSAMGITQQLYRPYAEFLQSRGFTVLTWDYYGTGASDGDQYRDVQSSIYDWAAVDQDAVITWLKQQYSGYDLNIVGHSLGGQIVGLMQHTEDVSALLGIAAQCPYWDLYEGFAQLRLMLFYYLVLPIFPRIFGYFPSGSFGLGVSLPKQAAIDWGKAGRKANAYIDVYGDREYNDYAEFKGALLLVGFSDDELAPPRAVHALLDFYPNSRIAEHITVTPEEMGLDSIGHTGFFRQQENNRLWQRTAEWLLNPKLIHSPQQDEKSQAQAKS